MSSCASTKKNGSVSSASRGRDPSASCAGAASTCTSPPAVESSKTAAHPSAAPSRVDAAATAAPEAVTPATGSRTTEVSLRMPPDFSRGGGGGGARGLVVVLLLVIVVVHRDGGGGVVGVHRVALVALAGVNRAQRRFERVLILCGFILGAQVTARGVGLTAGADAALGAVGVTIEGFMSVAGVA